MAEYFHLMHQFHWSQIKDWWIKIKDSFIFWSSSSYSVESGTSDDRGPWLSLTENHWVDQWVVEIEPVIQMTKDVVHNFSFEHTIVQIFLYTEVTRRKFDIDWPVPMSVLITKIPDSSLIVCGTLNGEPVKKVTHGLIGKIVNKVEGCVSFLLTPFA